MVQVSLYGTLLKLNLQPMYLMFYLSKIGIESVMEPKNMSHLLQPLDLTTNASLKKIKKRVFSKYFSSSIMEALKESPTCNVTTIKVDLRLSVFKSLHANVMKEVYQFFEFLKGKEVILNGWRTAGITKSLWQTCKRMKIV